jgi:hypothetical protein
MLCALNLDRRRQLPPDRMALYAASLDMLLERRDADRRINQAVKLDKTAKLGILQHLAWRLTYAGRVEMAFEDCVHHVSRAIERLPGVKLDPRETLRFLLERSGVIRDPAMGRVDFIHRTFQEYLAAKEAAEDHLMDALIREAKSDRWRETIIMADGHATARNRKEILEGMPVRSESTWIFEPDVPCRPGSVHSVNRRALSGASCSRAGCLGWAASDHSCLSVDNYDDRPWRRRRHWSSSSTRSAPAS